MCTCDIFWGYNVMHVVCYYDHKLLNGVIIFTSLIEKMRTQFSKKKKRDPKKKPLKEMVIIIWSLLTNRVSKFLSPQKKRVEPIQ